MLSSGLPTKAKRKRTERSDMDSETIEKKADVDRSKAIKAAIAAAVASAGVGAFVSGLKAKKNREKALDAFKSKNAIVVPIGIPDFVKDLPTPEEFKKMYAGSPDSSSADMSAEDIASRKKDILKGRKVNFFKRANKDQGESKTEQEGGEKKKELVSEEKIDGRAVLRGQDGKFVSPTDPVAVQQVEKEAGIWDAVKGWGDRAKGAFMGSPVVYTAGALGSLYLAAMIADYVNKKRREKTEENVDAAREEYVEKLQSEGGEKNASGEGSGLPEWAGTAFGASFFVPLAVTALVTNKILENRKQEKKKQKEMADSYPDDPIILYRTIDKMAGCREAEVSPENFIAALSMKVAMIKSAEHYEGVIRNCDLGCSEKKAQLMPYIMPYVVPPIRRRVKSYVRNNNPMSVDEASEMLSKMILDSGNSERVRDMLGGVLNENYSGISKSVSGMSGAGIRDKLRLESLMDDEKNRAEVMRRLMTNNNIQKYVTELMTDSKHDQVFGPLREQAVNRYLQNEWGLDPNGILFKIVSWIANNLGFGRYFAGKQLGTMFDAAKKQPQMKQPQDGTGTPAQNQAGNAAAPSGAVAQNTTGTQNAPGAPMIPNPPPRTQALQANQTRQTPNQRPFFNPKIQSDPDLMLPPEKRQGYIPPPPKPSAEENVQKRMKEEEIERSRNKMLNTPFVGGEQNRRIIV